VAEAKKRKKTVEEVEEGPFPVRFEELFGHRAQLEYLKRALSKEALPQSLLFIGKEGVGKRTLARMTAAALECTVKKDGACGKCRSCTKVIRAVHPDVVLVTRELNDRGKIRKEILIDQIRVELDKLALPPYEGKSLVVIIDPADALNENAQNALLKALEEPPLFAVFILITSNPSSLLPTVRSRCQTLTFHPLSNSEMEAFAAAMKIKKKLNPQNIALADGAPGRLFTMRAATEEKKRERILHCLRDGLSLKSYPDVALDIEALDKLPDREVLALTTSLLLDALRTASGAGPLVHVDLDEDLARIVEARGKDGLEVISSRLMEAPPHIDRNVNSRLLWQRVFLVP